MNKNKEQYVYVMSNPSYPADMLKIGWTREHPNIRANDLHTSGIPTPFIVEYVIITPEGSKLEKQIHNHIKIHRVNSNREFFKISKDSLKQILTDELNLQLTSITDLDAPTNKQIKGAVNKISELYEMLKKDWNEFSSPLKKEKMELVIRQTDNQKIINIIPNEFSRNPLAHKFADDGTEESVVKDVCYFIEKDIEQYAGYVDNILHNYQDIKERIGDKKLKEDNKTLKKWISDTHKELYELKKKYVWDI